MTRDGPKSAFHNPTKPIMYHSCFESIQPKTILNQYNLWKITECYHYIRYSTMEEIVGVIFIHCSLANTHSSHASCITFCNRHLTKLNLLEIGPNQTKVNPTQLMAEPKPSPTLDVFTSSACL